MINVDFDFNLDFNLNLTTSTSHLICQPPSLNPRFHSEFIPFTENSPRKPVSARAGVVQAWGFASEVDREQGAW